jgi:hypothetical protein
MNANLNIETISPKLAKYYLENIFDGQRQVRDSHVDKLAHDIREGRFRLSPDCILLVKGKLANGQHRLSAVVAAGLSCEFIVMRTDDEDLYKVIDSGIKRTEADCFAKLDYAKCSASIARLCVQYDKGALTPLGTDRNVIISRSDIIDYMESHMQELAEQSAKCQSLYRQKPVVPISLAGAMLHIGSRKDKAMADEFITAVYTGSTRDDSAFDVRERIMRNNASKAKLPRSYILGLLIKAFKSYTSGSRPGVLKLVDGERFPTV